MVSAIRALSRRSCSSRPTIALNAAASRRTSRSALGTGTRRPGVSESTFVCFDDSGRGSCARPETGPRCVDERRTPRIGQQAGALVLGRCLQRGVPRLLGGPEHGSARESSPKSF
jgi:hypothetical protein